MIYLTGMVWSIKIIHLIFVDIFWIALLKIASYVWNSPCLFVSILPFIPSSRIKTPQICIVEKYASHSIEDISDLKSSLKRSGSNASECCVSIRTPVDGYHTPRTPTTPGTPNTPGSPRGYHTPISEEGSPQHLQSPPGPPSPFSALNTVSLDAYLEPRRISFGSPPSSELNPRARSLSESYPVFSPPTVRRPLPSCLNQNHQSQLQTPRHSVISFSGRSLLSHHTCNVLSSYNA